MTTTVNILCPNGRRFNIKVSPNDTVMQVLEKVCAKGKFNFNEYDLRHQQKVLDVTVPFRYANIPNLAKLEMVKLNKPRRDSDVHVALQVDSGERLIHDFKSDCSLFEVLTHWDSVKEGFGLSKVKTEGNQTLQPVCIYMRREIIGQPWLQHMSLKSLGLTGGNAVIRHMHRATDLPPGPEPPKIDRRKSPDTKESSAVDVPTSSKDDTPEKTESGNPQHLPSVNKEDVSKTFPQGQKTDDISQRMSTEEMDTTEMAEMKHDNEKVVAIQDEPMDTEDGPSKSNEGDDVTKQPSPGAVPKAAIASQSSTVQRSQVAMETQGGAEMSSVDSFLQSHGAPSVPLDEKTRERIAVLMKKEQEMMREMNEVAQQLQSQQMVARSNPQYQAGPTFNDFKFPDKPQTAVKTEKKMKQKRQTTEGDDLSKPCERRTLVFHASDEMPSSEEFQYLPDSFFDVTERDMRKILSDLKSQQSSEKPLETKAMRDAKKMREMNKYSKVTIRIHFPDQNILQVFFRPKEKVEALYRFVDDSLQKNKGTFYLYTTPPKTILKNKSQTLFEANLCPTAKVYFGSEENHGPFLSEATLEKKVTLAQAEETAFGERQSFRTTPPSTSQPGPSTSQPSTSTSQPGSSTGQPGPSTRLPETAGPSQSKRKPSSETRSSPSSSSQGQVPKWFKMGKR